MRSGPSHDRGGFAFGELHESEPAIQERGNRGRDAPLSSRGRWIWRAVVGLLLAAVVVVAALVLASLD